jgi:nucleoside-diphosphate-sugar epimerase
MRYVLTGDSGMLGSVLGQLLREGGHVRVSPEPGTFHKWRSPSTGEEEPDFRTCAYVHWLESASFEVLFHAGALVGTTRCEAHAGDVWSCNVEGALRLAEVVARRSRRMVFFCSDSEMDPEDFSLEHPISLDGTVRNPRTRYGMTKLAARLLVEGKFREYGLDENLLGIYPSFGFGGARDGNSCVAEMLKCAAGLYDRRPFLPLDPTKVKEVTPHAHVARVALLACERRLFGVLPAASGVRMTYGDLVDLVRSVTSREVDPEWHPELDYKGDLVYDPEEVAYVSSALGLTPPDVREALAQEWTNVSRGGSMANHEWRFAERLAEGRNR